MAQYIYTMNRVSKVVPPKRTILRDISLSFFPGAKIGVLGLNGSGKSTLLQDHGGHRPEHRRRGPPAERHPRRLSAPGAGARPGQGRAQHGHGRRGRDLRQLSSEFNEISDKFAEPMSDERDDTRCSRSRRSCRTPSTPPAAGSWSASSRSPPMRCACRPGRRRSRPLSGGEKRRVALCRLLLSAPDMLLLDEPTNHLDAESIAWLERYLEEYPSTVIAVTHDRYFLDNVAEWILELDRGHGIPWHGNYSSWLEQKEQRLEARGARARSAAQDPRAGARVGAPESQGAPGEEQGPPAALRGAGLARNSRSATRPTRSTFRRASGSASW